jgi:hypothetical protein
LRDQGISQAELSRNEAAGDHLVSTSRRYVEALGGELSPRREVARDRRSAQRPLRLNGRSTPSRFVLSLASSAFVHMGAAPHPEIGAAGWALRPSLGTLGRCYDSGR